MCMKSQDSEDASKRSMYLFCLLLEGCGVGGGVYVQTLDAAPEDLLPPAVKATGAHVLEINWSPPRKPNGLITSYHIYR